MWFSCVKKKNLYAKKDVNKLIEKKIPRNIYCEVHVLSGVIKFPTIEYKKDNKVHVLVSIVCAYTKKITSRIIIIIILLSFSWLINTMYYFTR